VAAGLMVGGVPPGAPAYAVSKSVCLKMGHYFQIQDDYLDCYGDPAVIGKVGTDIQDNKCSWLVVQALTKANDAQRKILTDNYGKDDAAAVAAVKALYVDLGLEAAFRAYEEAAHASLVAEVEGQADVPAGVFMPLLAKIFKRSK
jgi:farnesyl diphosphate synthase